MTTSKPSYTSNTKGNILIVDEKGEIGEALAELLSEQATVILVSKNNPKKDLAIIHIPFASPIPEIPDGTYSKTIYVFDPKTKDLIDPLFQKSEFDQGTFLVVVSHTLLPLLQEVLKEKEKKVITIVYGDIFGRGEGEIDTWLSEVKKTKKIILPNMGLNCWYPLLFEDMIVALAHFCFENKAENSTVIMSPIHPVTQLSLSHALQKTDPTIRVDFGRETKDKSLSLPKGEEFLKNYNSTEAVVGYYKKMQMEETLGNRPVLYLNKSENKKKKNNWKSLPLLFIYTFLVFLFMPLLLVTVVGIMGRNSLFSSIDSLKSGKLDASLQKIKEAKKEISLTNLFFSLVEQEINFTGQAYRLEPVKAQLEVALLASDTLDEGISASKKLYSVLSGTSQNPNQDIINSSNSLEDVLIRLQKLQTYTLPNNFKSQITSLTSYFPYLETTFEALPDLLSGDEKKYLVVFQNNTELRPGGGFIGSYGLLKLSHGKFVSFNINNVYDADGQLKGHVEPSFEIRRYIPLVHLYLRDSNFDIDSVNNAKKEAYMLQAETGDRVDGVIGVDLSLVKNLLGALGGVYVPNYNENVTSDNFFLLTEQHAEKDSFAGSTQKQDFLSALFFAIQKKITDKTVNYESLSKALLKGVTQKHLLFALLDPVVQAPFGANGMSSALIDSREDSRNVLNDFLGINEANLGVDKVNYYIKRSVSQKVLVSGDGRVAETVSLSLQNTSDGQWPGGEYKNYIRFILPKDVSLTGVNINGEDQKIVPAVTDPKIYEASSFVAPKGLEVAQNLENDKKIFGFLVVVPIKSTTNIIISYTRSRVVDISQSLPNYSLQIFKQPGIDSFPYTLEVAYPQGFGLLNAANQVKVSNSVASLSKDIDEDTLINLSWVKK